VPRIPLIEDLTTDPIPTGSNLLVAFDPTSQWINAHVTIAAGWLKTEGRITYHISMEPRERIRTRLRRLGLENLGEPEGLNENYTLVVHDWYTPTLGRKTEDSEFSFASLKIADLSIDWAKGEKEAEEKRLFEKPARPVLRIVDSVSFLSRFNDEKVWVEFVLNRVIPRAQKWNQVTMIGIVRGVHSDWVYKTLEGASDGVIDFKLEETGEETTDLMRIRSMRQVGFDRKWHKLTIGEGFKVELG
jgi:hypothetical protein